MSNIAKWLAYAAALARKAPASITQRIGTTAGRGVRLLREDIEPRIRRYGASSAASLALLLQPLSHSARAAPAANGAARAVFASSRLISSARPWMRPRRRSHALG
jgi:hypothetical protein